MVWHIDDLNFLHMEQSVVDDIIMMLESTYSEIPTQREKKFIYLGTGLDYRTKKMIKVKVCDFIEDILKESSKDMKSTAATPAANHLFTVNKKLEDSRSHVFYTFTARLLFLC